MLLLMGDVLVCVCARKDEEEEAVGVDCLSTSIDGSVVGGRVGEQSSAGAGPDAGVDVGKEVTALLLLCASWLSTEKEQLE